MKILDINTAIGGQKPATGEKVLLAQLLAYLHTFRIDHCVCYHVYACSDPQTGNAQMAQLAAQSGGKVGACMVLDPMLLENSLPGQGTLASRAAACGAEALRVFPDNNSVPFHRLYWGELLDEVAQTGLPLIVECEYNDVFFSNLPDILEHYPEIPFVLLRCGLWNARKIEPLLKHYGNVWFDMSTMMDSWQLEQMMELNGCSRLVLGSGYPSFTAAGALGLAYYAQIPMENKAAILAGNWEGMTK